MLMVPSGGLSSQALIVRYSPTIHNVGFLGARFSRLTDVSRGDVRAEQISAAPWPFHPDLSSTGWMGERMNESEIRPARAGDLAAIAALLADCGLPSGDLSVAHLASFFVATVDDRLIGVAGLESLESTGLLRSLAVAPAYRGGGLARRLVEACEVKARDKRTIAELYLLTTTAADYFLRCGYSEVPRASVPAGVAAHPQFRGLCPASARCLRKRLRENGVSSFDAWVCGS